MVARWTQVGLARSDKSRALSALVLLRSRSVAAEASARAQRDQLPPPGCLHLEAPSHSSMKPNRPNRQQRLQAVADGGLAVAMSSLRTTFRTRVTKMNPARTVFLSVGASLLSRCGPAV